MLFFCACAYQGVRNVSFSENFAYLLNEWPPSDINVNVIHSIFYADYNIQITVKKVSPT